MEKKDSGSQIYIDAKRMEKAYMHCCSKSSMEEDLFPPLLHVRVCLCVCMYNGGSKNEAKRGEESWPTVASGSGPSLSKSSPRSPPPPPSGILSPFGTTRQYIQVCFFFLSSERNILVISSLWPPPFSLSSSIFPASFPFTLFYNLRSGFSLTFPIS